VSGHADDEMARRGLLDAGRPFLQKPFDPHEIAVKVRELLQGRTDGRSDGRTGGQADGR
jgi:DNA-binding response OmpR family regulator